MLVSNSPRTTINLFGKKQLITGCVISTRVSAARRARAAASLAEATVLELVAATYAGATAGARVRAIAVYRCCHYRGRDCHGMRTRG